MPEQSADGPVAAHARSYLAAARVDRDWFRAAVTSLEAAGDRIVQTLQPAERGDPWVVLDWRTGAEVAAFSGGEHAYEAAWPDGWTDVAWIGAWPENLAGDGRPGPDWPEVLPPPPPAPDLPPPLALPVPASLADRVEETIETWAAEAAVIPARAAEVAILTGWTKDEVLACTASWLTITGEEYMRLGGTGEGSGPSRTRRTGDDLRR